MIELGVRHPPKPRRQMGIERNPEVQMSRGVGGGGVDFAEEDEETSLHHLVSCCCWFRGRGSNGRGEGKVGRVKGYGEKGKRF